MSQKNNILLKEKAKKHVIDERWDYLLCHAFLETKNFPFWVKNRDEFEENWNIGLKNISSEQRLLQCGYVKEITEFLSAELNGIHFKIGGFQQYNSAPDGESFVTLSISLLINERVVLSVRYTDNKMEPYRASDWDILDVEEMHSTPEIPNLLLSIEKAIDERDKLAGLRQKQIQNAAYKGKFSFEDAEPRSRINSDQIFIQPEEIIEPAEHLFQNNAQKFFDIYVTKKVLIYVVVFLLILLILS
jgi:hypothetical protein